ncbi:MAG: helix-turn-helix transcriptional regulator [Gammaproteobacteria bacterium]|nr:helix-turn-helix transcriptional regulator [Gammaproteobacteria bacterium]
MSVFSARLKQARMAAGLSQERLGVLAGIEEASASARMNQYEKGKHNPDFSVVERIAKVLDVPEAYFYAKSDDVAELLIAFHRSSESKRQLLLDAAKPPA